MNVPTPREIREQRVKLGLRQTEVAKKAGLSQSMIARIESGSVDPRVSTLSKIIAVLQEAEETVMRAKDIMHTPVISVTPSDTISHTVAIMEKYGISQLPVLSQGVPVGCISESAIIVAMEEGHISKKEQHTVCEIIEEAFPTAPPSVDLDTIVHILHNHHALLVLDKGKVVGVITKHDLIALIA